MKSYEIAKTTEDVGDIASTFTRGFMSVPGVQTLGKIGDTLFNKRLTLKQKRELFW